MHYTAPIPRKDLLKALAWWPLHVQGRSHAFWPSCPEPCVDEAVEGLRRDMLSLGLIWDEPQPDRDRKRRILTNWSLTDDILPRTPATDNEF